jgi:hypothetical protein
MVQKQHHNSLQQHRQLNITADHLQEHRGPNTNMAQSHADQKQRFLHCLQQHRQLHITADHLQESIKKHTFNL